MSIWATELAPNLFNSYDAWYRNYIKECGCYPGTDELKVAEDYFKLINKFIDITDEANKTCEHCHYWDQFEKDVSDIKETALAREALDITDIWEKELEEL